MSLFARPSSYSLNHHTQHPASPFTPLLRFLSDFDDLNNFHRDTPHLLQSKMPAFNPKFDVREIPSAYELHGELPGIEQKDIEIEFTDSQTLTVKGRTERSYSSVPVNGAITESNRSEDEKKKTGLQPTIEDEGEDGGNSHEEEKAVEKNGEAGAVEKRDPKEVDDKLWVSERSVGEFARSFSFPDRVDQDAVKASFKNGVLSIVVPKILKKEGGKKIMIQ